MLRLLLRTLSWLGLAAVVLVGSFALLAAGSVAYGAWLRGQVTAAHAGLWLLIVRGIALQALLPHLLLTGATWALIAWRRPRLDGRWPTMAAGLALVALAWFPLVGGLLFTMWRPGSWVDYANTLWLTAGGVTAALLLARRLARSRLGPGALVGEAGPVR